MSVERTERDTIAEIIAEAGWDQPFEELLTWQRAGVDAIADALLGVFDITPRKEAKTLAEEFEKAHAEFIEERNAAPRGTEALPDGEDAIAAALQPFGWTCGHDFWQRYYTDGWVFSLANAVERLSRDGAGVRQHRDTPTREERTGKRTTAERWTAEAKQSAAAAVKQTMDGAGLVLCQVEKGWLAENPSDPFGPVMAADIGFLVHDVLAAAVSDGVDPQTSTQEEVQ